jgi:hypothetical protein
MTPSQTSGEVCALRETIPQSRDHARKIPAPETRDQHEAVAINQHGRDLELRANLPAHQFRCFAQERVVERAGAAQNNIDRCAIDLSFYGICEQFELRAIGSRTRHRQHQRRRLTELLDSLHRPSALRQIG